MPFQRDQPVRPIIYGLTDPRNGQTRYIGKTVSPKSRMYRHLLARGTSDCARWVRSLQAAGLQPGMVVLEVVEECNWADRERFWIAYFRQLGIQLTNMLGGGDGRDGAPLSECHRAAISRGMRGHTISEETRAKLSRAAQQRWGDPQFREKVAAAQSRPEVVERHRVGGRMTGDLNRQRSIRKRGS